MAKRKQQSVSDPRLGIGDVWPSVSLLGQPYDKTQSTVRFDATYFVVLDRFISIQERDRLLDEVRALIDGTVTNEETDTDESA